MNAVPFWTKFQFFCFVIQLVALIYQLSLYFKIEKATATWAILSDISRINMSPTFDADQANGARDIARQVRAEQINGQIDKIRREIRAAADNAQTKTSYEGECTEVIKKYFEARGFHVNQENHERPTGYGGNVVFTVCTIDWEK